MFSPVYTITPGITKALMSIEADRQAVADLPIALQELASLRETARLVSTHYSTQIEGNRLTQTQVKEVVAGARFPGRERDELEVRHHYRVTKEVKRSVRRDSGETRCTSLPTIGGRCYYRLRNQPRRRPTRSASHTT